MFTSPLYHTSSIIVSREVAPHLCWIQSPAVPLSYSSCRFPTVYHHYRVIVVATQPARVAAMP